MEIETFNYIQAIESSLSATVPVYRVDAINSFIVKEKLSDRWGFHKYLWLPVWGNESANRVCLINGILIGSYPKGATHGASYVKGNGTTQYFNSGVFAYDTLSANNTHIFALTLNSPASGTFYGVGQHTLDVEMFENTGMMYQLSGYQGQGYDCSTVENTGMMYQLSGYLGDVVIQPYSDDAGLLWDLSGTLT